MTGTWAAELLTLLQTVKTRENTHLHLRRRQFSSVSQSCPTLCDPMGCSTPGLPVHHQLPEPAQTHVHWVCDAIQLSHPLLSFLLLPSIFPSIRVFSNESVLCIKWPNIGVSALASVLLMNIQGWFPLGLTGLIFNKCNGHNRNTKTIYSIVF